jgi:hypothetical protein
MNWKHLISALPLLLCNSITAEECQISDVVSFAGELAQRYESKEMAKLDAKYNLYSFEVVSEHSLSEDGEHERKTVANFSALESWLKSNTTSGLPYRAIRKLEKCGEGLCLFDYFEGVSHSHLYLYSFEFSGTNKCAKLTRVNLYNGD